MLLTRPLCSSDPFPYLASPITTASRPNARSLSPVSNRRGQQSLSTPQLDRCVDKTIATHFAGDALPSPAHFADASQRAQSAYLRSSASPIEAVSKTYAKTCALFWQSLFSSVPPSALTQSSQQLQIVWARGRCCSPNDSFFAEGTTLAAELSEKWRSPHVQTALCEATTQLLSLTDSASSNISIDGYSSSWAYLCGRVMYQLLQWNHQLTPETLRELFS